MIRCNPLFLLYLLSFTLGIHASRSEDDSPISYNLSTKNLKARTIASQGFEDCNNRYAWSMESFNGKVYVGTLNIKFFGPGMLGFLAAGYVQFSRTFSNGGEVYEGTRSDTGEWDWKRVLTGGLRCKHNYGIRKLIVVGNYMYGVTGNNDDGFDIIQTSDGSNWETVMSGGFGTNNNISGRGMIEFDGYLYIGTANFVDGAEIWRHLLADDGSLDSDSEWEDVVRGGNGDELNSWFGDMVNYNGFIYVGTLNGGDTGGELHRSSNGVDWEVVLTDGAGLSTDRAFMKLYVYQDHLYVGTMNYRDGASLLVSTDANATQFDRLFTAGNDNANNAYIWYMIEYDNKLYVSSFNFFIQVNFDIFDALDVTDGNFLPFNFNYPVQFDLFSHEDPTDGTPFTIESRNNFAARMYGVRSMVVHDGLLLMGSASLATARVWEATNETTTTTHDNIFSRD